MYNDKGNTKYLKLLKQNYSSSQDVKSAYTCRKAALIKVYQV